MNSNNMSAGGMRGGGGSRGGGRGGGRTTGEDPLQHLYENTKTWKQLVLHTSTDLLGSVLVTYSFRCA